MASPSDATVHNMAIARGAVLQRWRTRPSGANRGLDVMADTQLVEYLAPMPEVSSSLGRPELPEGLSLTQTCHHQRWKALIAGDEVEHTYARYVSGKD